MELIPKETIDALEELAKKHDEIKIILDVYHEWMGDPQKRLYSTLQRKVLKWTEELEAGTLDLEDANNKSIMTLMDKGDRIASTLARMKMLIDPDAEPDETTEKQKKAMDGVVVDKIDG